METGTVTRSHALRGRPARRIGWGFLGLAVLCGAAAGSGPDEFRIKRSGPFAFAQKPVVTRAGDRVAIAFEAKGLCDVTVAVEDEKGRIVRHLVSGVLGPNAPEPLQRDAKKQTVVWDGKDDQGVYMDDKDKLTVRVSLGLKPRFERTLYWSPKKRITPGNRPNFVSAPEGVYIHEGGGVDHIRLFTHDGKYVRTVYPFPPDRSLPGAMEGRGALKIALSKVRGLKWMTFPQDGLVLPVWQGLVQATLFTSGSNTLTTTHGKYGQAASAMALHDDRLALVMYTLNRLATDGTTGGMPLEGPTTAVAGTTRKVGGRAKEIKIVPESAAFSPDGKWLYLTGYRGVHAVARMAYLGEKPPEAFAGQMVQGRGGAGENQFRDPVSLDVDAAGRVYVADYNNDRIQVFTPDGTLYKSIPTPKPARVFVDPKSGHIYVGSWLLLLSQTPRDARAEAAFRHLGPVDDPKQIASYPLPFANYSSGVFMNRSWNSHEIWMDFRTPSSGSGPGGGRPTLWVVPGSGDTTEKLIHLRAIGTRHRSRWMGKQYQLYQEEAGKLVKKADFARDVVRAVVEVDPPAAPAGDRQRLYVDPSSGDLYVAEGDSGVGKAFRKLLRIDPDTGRIRVVPLPFTTEDMAIDLSGQVYLRTDRQVSRFRLSDWREVPYDYGGEWAKPGFDGDGQMLRAAIALTGAGRPAWFHQGGFGVSPDGCVVVSCFNVKPLEIRMPGAFGKAFRSAKPYRPTVYPGRIRWAEIHVWDERGRVLYEDAVKGLPVTDGLALDKDHNIYALVAANRVQGGEEYPLIQAETLVKFRRNKGKLLSTGRHTYVPLPRDSAPKGSPDLIRGEADRGAWVEGAEWFYGGVGFRGGKCCCWNARPGLDLYGRSFVTELNRFRVAVLDTSGNLVMRIGRYGNVDDGVPLVKKGGPAKPRPAGGDEVALCHPSYVAAHTDRRLFIADYGNARILSVKLGYHTQERVALKDVADREQGEPDR